MLTSLARASGCTSRYTGQFTLQRLHVASDSDWKNEVAAAGMSLLRRVACLCCRSLVLQLNGMQRVSCIILFLPPLPSEDLRREGDS